MPNLILQDLTMQNSVIKNIQILLEGAAREGELNHATKNFII